MPESTQLERGQGRGGGGRETMGRRASTGVAGHVWDRCTGLAFRPRF